MKTEEEFPESKMAYLLVSKDGYGFVMNGKNEAVLFRTQAVATRVWLEQGFCLKGYIMKVYKASDVARELREADYVPVWYPVVEQEVAA